LDKVSELKQLEDKPPPSEEALRRRADRDLERMADAVHSLGYWDAALCTMLIQFLTPPRLL
jgi:translocation and assembly module TamA